MACRALRAYVAEAAKAVGVGGLIARQAHALSPPRPDCRSYLITAECRTGKEALVSIAREGLESSDHILSAGDSHFFAGGVHQEAMARLEHLVEGGSRCGIVVGPRGTGKSTVLNVFAQDCRAIGCETVAIDVTGRDGVEFLERLSQRLGVTSRARGRASALWTEVSDALAGRERAGQHCVLVIDHLDRALSDCQHWCGDSRPWPGAPETCSWHFPDDRFRWCRANGVSAATCAWSWHR